MSRGLAGNKPYESPEVGTLFPLSSVYAENIYVGVVKRIADVLAEKGLISEYMKPLAPPLVLLVRFSEYASKVPVRKHCGKWIDGGDQVVVFHPDTFVPFFLNYSASRIAKMCDGKTNVEKLLRLLKKDETFERTGHLVEDLMRFLLLLEELDLIEFVE